MSDQRCGSAAVYRRLLLVYPRRFRDRVGPEMVQLVRDRRVVGREPLWRLWPSLLGDTTRNAVTVRWETLMSTSRALVLGALATLCVLAILSSGFIGLPIVALAVVVGTMVWRQRPATSTTPTRSWRRWIGAGVIMLVVAIGYFVPVSGEELGEAQWAFVFFGIFGGLFATATGVIILLSQRPRSATG